jgi:hypothetical protein
MKYLSQDQGFGELAARQWDIVIANQCKEIKGLGVLRTWAKTAIPQIDADLSRHRREIVKGGRSWMETG